MLFFATLFSILQSISVSLGLGCSTLAIVNFFVAIADGRIDENERRMMGVVYLVLRIAMIFILLSTIVLGAYNIVFLKLDPTPFIFAQWTLIVILFLNSVLMSKHRMPSAIGPALQAATWYTLGILFALLQIRSIHFSYLQFVLAYIAVIALAVAVVNGIMTLLHSKKSTENTSVS